MLHHCQTETATIGPDSDRTHSDRTHSDRHDRSQAERVALFFILLAKSVHALRLGASLFCDSRPAWATVQLEQEAVALVVMQACDSRIAAHSTQDAEGSYYTSAQCVAMYYTQCVAMYYTQGVAMYYTQQCVQNITPNNTTQHDSALIKCGLSSCR